MATEPNGPVARLSGDAAAFSLLLGLPVRCDDGFRHAPECHWCHGEADQDTCPRSVHLREVSGG